jgi:hypothetical protein
VPPWRLKNGFYYRGANEEEEEEEEILQPCVLDTRFGFLSGVISLLAVVRV